MLCKPPIWVLLCVHIVLLFMHKHGLDLGMLVSGDDNASAMTTFLLVIFLVYLGGQTYTRYFMMFDACMGMANAVQAWVGRAHRQGRTLPRAADDVASW